MLRNIIFYFSVPGHPVTRSEVIALWKSLTLEEKERFIEIFHP